jgi:uncharacterized membrane protein
MEACYNRVYTKSLFALFSLVCTCIKYFGRISRQPFPVKIMIDQKQLENVESLGSMLTNDGNEIKSRIAMAKAAFSKKRALFTGILDLKLRMKLVKCYIWSMALYGAETATIRAVDQKHLESFEMWCWRRSVGPIM